MILLTEWFPGKFQLPFSIARKYQEVGQLPVPGSSLLIGYIGQPTEVNKYKNCFCTPGMYSMSNIYMQKSLDPSVTGYADFRIL
jgi:hypothetical protein